MCHSLSVTVQPPAVSSIGSLTLAYTGKRIALSVLRSAAGYSIGTADHLGPSCESVEYFRSHAAARHALDTGAWTQRQTP